MDLIALTLAPGASAGERIKVWMLPANDSLVCTLHNGPFVIIGEAYNAMGKWINDNGYRITGPCREVYLKPAQNGGHTDPETVTEIQFPIEKVKRSFIQ